MSFFINNNNSFRPGNLSGNNNGICERVCLEVKKVFDACMCQLSETGLRIPLSNFSPSNPAFPLTYISTQNQGHDCLVSDVTIDRLTDRPNFANVSCMINVPVVTHCRDANGTDETAEGMVTVPFNGLLFVPQPSLTPIEIESFSRFTSVGGTMENTTAIVNGCLHVNIKVVALVDVLVPSYGYPVIPPCHAATPTSMCHGLFDLPLFPSAISPSGR